MTRIITEGFLDYPLRIMLKHYLYRAEHYPECVTVINRMLADSYQQVRHALVVEHEGRVVGTALLHDRTVGFVRSFLSGGYELFRYASPLLVKERSDAVGSGDQVTAEKGDFGWYLEALSVDKQMRGRGVGRWLVSQVLPDYVAKRGGRVWICDVHRRECTLLPQWRV